MFIDGTLLFSLCNMAVVFFGLVTIFLGIVVMRQNKGMTKEFGYFLLIYALIVIYNGGSSLVARMGVGALSVYGFGKIFVSLLEILAVTFLFLYAKRKYNATGLLFVVILPFIWYFICRIAQVLIIRLNSDIVYTPVYFGIINAASYLMLMGIMIYIAIVYYRNRNIETAFPALWIFMIILVMSYVINMIIAVASYIESVESLIMILMLVRAIIYPAMALYLMTSNNGGWRIESGPNPY